MKVVFSSLDKNKAAGGWQETAVYVEEALQDSGHTLQVLRPPNPLLINTCDIFYEGTYVPKISKQSFDVVKSKSPNAVFVLQMINSHPTTYCAIYQTELRKYGLRDERFDDAWARPFRNMLIEADVIFCHSEWIKKTLIENHKPESAIRVIPKGVDTSFWAPEPQDRVPFRVGFAGQLQLIKGIQYLFEAWRILKSPGQLWICGPKVTYLSQGRREWACGKIFDKYLNSAYKGWLRNREDLKRFYNALDVFIAPSLEDGWNMTAVEAMACAKPVITTTTTGMSQIIEEGVNGFVIAPGSTEEIVEKLAWCRDHKSQLKVMGIAARETVLKYDIPTYKQNFIRTLFTQG